MAPAVILIGCLLATMSCSTTAQNTTPPTTDTTTTTTSVTSLPATTPPAPAPTTTTDTTPSSTPPASTTSTTPGSPPTTIPESSTPPTTTTEIPVNPPTYGSCGNPDLCCSGVNNSCHRLNCYCDVACLRFGDCCPDFKLTCLTVNNSTTLPLTGTCSEPTLCCSGVNYNCFRGCFCDEVCQQLNDCCPDLNSTCIFNSTTTDSPFDSTADPPFDSTADPPFDPTADPPFDSTAAPPQETTVTSNTSSATTIPVTTRPGVTNATTTTTTTSQTPLSGSCGNPNLCCSGVNNSCHRLNCFCDVACLRFGDCCPDFKHTCLTVNSSSNGTKPNNTLPLTGKCSHPTLCCSGVNYNCFRGCFCDEACKQLNDCCPDLNSTCIFNTTTAAPPINSTAAPPQVTTVTSNISSATTIPVTTRPGVTNATTTTKTQTPLSGSCGNPNLCCSGVNSSCRRLNCYCDVACLRFGDCCPDFKLTCLTVNSSSNGTKPNNTLPLTGKCSHPTLCCSGVNYNCFRGCFCDEACKQLNDCCPDLNSTCIFNTTTTPPPFMSTTNPPVISTAAPTLDVLTLLTNLEVEVLAEESSTEEERQAALRQVGALLESYLRENNTDIYSFEVTRIQPVSPCD